MPAKIIDGQALAEKIKDNIVKEILELNNNKPDCPHRPNLGIILVGDREDSKLYVSLKEKEAKKSELILIFTDARKKQKNQKFWKS